MDIQHDNDENIQELITERNNCLPSIISSFSVVENNSKLLGSVKECAKYLPTYNASNVDVELLQHVIPVIRKCLHKAYEDNFLMSNSVDDDFVLDILKENLQVTLGFIQVTKAIVEFLSQNDEVNLNDLNNTPTDLAKLILLTFEHCKNSSDTYKATFSLELLEIFRVTQEVHSLFIRLFESYVIIKDGPCNAGEIKVLRQVLEIICNMSEILASLNIKSMSDNWKGYTAITQKFSDLLTDTIDLKVPIQSLTSEILKNMTSLQNMDEIGVQSQIIKITGFLVKVALKIFDIFWNCREKISKELLYFFCTIYSFPPDICLLHGYPGAISELIENVLFKPIKPFLMRLANDAAFVKIFTSQNLTSCKYSFGLVNFLNNALHLLVLNDKRLEDLRIDVIIRVIFNNVKSCYTQFFWANVFNDLIINIAAIVMVYEDCFSEVEGILLANLLQEDIWSALLSLEVWSLVLCNSNPQTCLDTLTSLIRKHQALEFGLLTHRLEQVYLKCLMQRLFKILPSHMKIEVVKAFNPAKDINTWKMLEFKYFPVQQKFIAEDICMTSAGRVGSITNGSGSVNDVIFVAERLAVLSTVNFDELNCTKWVNAVHSLWEFNVDCNDLRSNNLFKYFMIKLCKITIALIGELDSRQAITVLTQLKALSTDDFYRLLACDALVAFSKAKFENNQDRYRIYTSIADVIYPDLLSTTSGVVKQIVLEVIQYFAISGHHEVVKNVVRVSDEMRGRIIVSYLKKDIFSNKLDKDYLALLGGVAYQHECIKWKTDVSQPRSKKPKIEDPMCVDELRNSKSNHANGDAFSKVESVKVEDKTERISEVLDSIKGEVKCLVNVLKSEKLSRKNASDIKLIANHLLSLL